MRWKIDNYRESNAEKNQRTKTKKNNPKKIEQKGMAFDHGFGYFFPPSLLKKREEEKENE